jgi:hypothetical protein
MAILCCAAKNSLRGTNTVCLVARFWLLSVNKTMYSALVTNKKGTDLQAQQPAVLYFTAMHF